MAMPELGPVRRVNGIAGKHDYVTLATLSPDWDGKLRIAYVQVRPDRAAAFSREIARAMQ